MRKRTFNRRRWLHGESSCNAYVLVDAEWRPGDKDAEEVEDTYDFLESVLEINLGGRSTSARLYGSVISREVSAYMRRLDELIKTLTEAREWIGHIKDDFVREEDKL